MDANQSIQEGREGEAEGAVEDGVGGEWYWRGGEGSVVWEGGRVGVLEGVVFGGGNRGITHVLVDALASAKLA